MCNVVSHDLKSNPTDSQPFSPKEYLQYVDSPPLVSRMFQRLFLSLGACFFDLCVLPRGVDSLVL